ncbi:hypothetical protein U9M48_025690 [Paspalum notatum var. saurae]|uniref:Uncharacterized protein n=1 Tax=Paspalum notatum var. saurae TaxID=547442 RepID=A0AAQ3TT33_PASNO
MADEVATTGNRRQSIATCLAQPCYTKHAQPLCRGSQRRGPALITGGRKDHSSDSLGLGRLAAMPVLGDDPGSSDQNEAPASWNRKQRALAVRRNAATGHVA